MLTETTAKRLAALPAKARELAEIQLRADGALGATDPLEMAFVQDPSATRRDMLDCLIECDEGFDKTMEDCETDACKAGAAIALRKCIKGC